MTEPTMSAAELQEENHKLREALRAQRRTEAALRGDVERMETAWRRETSMREKAQTLANELESRLAGQAPAPSNDWVGSDIDRHFDARCDALSKRVDELEANQMTTADRRVLAGLLEWLTNDKPTLDVIGLCDGWREPERERIKQAREAGRQGVPSQIEAKS